MFSQLSIFEMPLPESVETLPTLSPINELSISGQNGKVYNYMKENGSINMLQAHSIGVMHLHSRISDLRNHDKIKLTIYDRFIKVNGIDMKEYSLKQFNK